MRRYTAAPVTDVRAEHAEGPAWDARRDELLWVDQFGGLVHRGRAGSNGVLQVVRTYQVGSAVGAVVPVAAEGGGWLIAAGAGFAYLSPEGGVTVLAEPEAAVRERNRMNDGKCDAHGRFYAGSMAWSKQPGAGSLYRYAANEGITTVLNDVTISNGLAWHRGGLPTSTSSAASGSGADLRRRPPGGRPARRALPGLTVRSADRPSRCAPRAAGRPAPSRRPAHPHRAR